MELKTGKVRPIGGESTDEVMQQLCTQFALLVDEVGYKLSLASQDNQDLAKRVAALETGVVNLVEEG